MVRFSCSLILAVLMLVSQNQWTHADQAVPGHDGGELQPIMTQTSSGDAGPAEVKAQVAKQWDGFVEPKNPRPNRPGTHGPGPWYLGVYGSYTSTGMLLTEVYPQTAAARAGLQVGDRILTVNGHQIGVVNGYRIPIDAALQRYATRSGHVRLLVQDRNTMRLVNTDARLTRSGVHTID